jgi:hypothetical protein
MNGRPAIITKNPTGLNSLAISSRIQPEAFLAGKIVFPARLLASEPDR